MDTVSTLKIIKELEILIRKLNEMTDSLENTIVYYRIIPS